MLQLFLGHSTIAGAHDTAADPVAARLLACDPQYRPAAGTIPRGWAASAKANGTTRGLRLRFNLYRRSGPSLLVQKAA